MFIIKALGRGLAQELRLFAFFLSIIIHVWTIIIAYSSSGIFAAILSLIFPGLSETYWFFKTGNNAGYGSNYCIAIEIYLALMLVAILGSLLFKSKQESD